MNHQLTIKKNESCSEPSYPHWDIYMHELKIGGIWWSFGGYYFCNANRPSRVGSRIKLQEATLEKIAEIVYQDYISNYDPYPYDYHLLLVDTITSLDPIERSMQRNL